MPAQRKLIKGKEVARRFGCHPKTVARGAFNLKRYPMNPNAKIPTWLYEEKEVEERLAERERMGR
jgi:hypothetical protein